MIEFAGMQYMHVDPLTGDVALSIESFYMSPDFSIKLFVFHVFHYLRIHHFRVFSVSNLHMYIGAEHAAKIEI